MKKIRKPIVNDNKCAYYQCNDLHLYYIRVCNYCSHCKLINKQLYCDLKVKLK